MYRSWQLIETRRTDHRREPILAEKWPGDWQQAFEHGEVIVERIHNTEGDQPQLTLDRLAPAHVQKTLSTLLRDALGTHAASRRNGSAVDRIVAARVGFRAIYGYDVSLEYEGGRYKVAVAGGGDVVMPNRLPPARRNPFSIGKRLVKTYFRALQTDEVPGPKEAFIRAVSSGRAHISDDACLIPDVAVRLRSEAEVTEEGYRCVVSDYVNKEGAVNVILDVTFALDEQDRQLLCVDIDLGEANRDRFSHLLHLTHGLPIGRLAIVNDSNGGERIRLIDRRPYTTCDADQYIGVLRILAATVRRLRGTGIVS